MSQNKTITINGRQYDAITGLPVQNQPVKKTPKATAKPTTQSTPATKARATSTAARSIHGSTVQRSATLRKRTAKKPTPTRTPLKPSSRGVSMDIAKSSRVSKFAPHPATAEISRGAVTRPASKPATSTARVTSRNEALKKPVAPKPKPVADKAPQPHYVAQKAVKRAEEKKASLAKKASTKTPTGAEVKKQAINKALSTPKSNKSKKIKLSPWKKGVLIGVLVITVLTGAGFAVYKLVPSVSVSIASMRSGVNATYPDFVPDGFRLHQPVTYSEGEVLLTFASNSNDDNYKIRQTKSSWDSTAVLDNVVRPAAGENYITTQERGLTIYSYQNSASWVNGGILYTIDGNSQLSNEQIRRIATSL